MRLIRSARAGLACAAFSGAVVLAACNNTGEAREQPATPATATQTASQPSEARVAAANLPLAVVYKDPSCGCCTKWVEHMQASGFQVQAHDTTAMEAIKNEDGVPANTRSCHTTRVGGYVIEGHVPADLVKKLLAEKPADIAGLAVPGMVTGSPGMEMPGQPADHYDVIAFTKDGQTRVYASR